MFTEAKKKKPGWGEGYLAFRGYARSPKILRERDNLNLEISRFFSLEQFILYILIVNG